MEILIKSNTIAVLEEIVESFKDVEWISSGRQDCYLGDRTIEINEENKDLIIINIE